MVVYHQDRRAPLIGIQVCWAVLSILFYAFRTYTRLFIVRSFGIDDYLIGMAVIPSIAIAITTSIGTKWGWGLHLDEIVDMSYYHLELISWLSQLLFTISTTFVKASILYFYLRLAVTRTYRRVIWGSFIFIMCWGVTFFFVVIFQCHPPSAYWTTHKNDTSKCITITIPLGIHGIMNTLTDLYLFLLPMPMLWNVQLPKKQRIGLISLFGFGFIVVIAGSVRLYYSIVTVESFDYTWVGFELWTWESIEINLSIICACVPTIKPLAIRVFPRLLSLGTNPHSHTYLQNPGISPNADKAGHSRLRSYESNIFDGNSGKSYAMGTVSTAAATRSKDMAGDDNGSKKFLTTGPDVILQTTSFGSSVHVRTSSEVDLETGNARSVSSKRYQMA